MIEIIPFAKANIIGFRLDGKIDDDSYKQAVARIQNLLDDNDTIRIYAEVVSLEGMSVETFFENIKVKFGFFSDRERFERQAIVSDKQWVEILTNISGRLFPSVEVKYFSFAEKEEALAWVKN